MLRVCHMQRPFEPDTDNTGAGSLNSPLKFFNRKELFYYAFKNST